MLYLTSLPMTPFEKMKSVTSIQRSSRKLVAHSATEVLASSAPRPWRRRASRCSATAGWAWSRCNRDRSAARPTRRCPALEAGRDVVDDRAGAGRRQPRGLRDGRAAQGGLPGAAAGGGWHAALVVPAAAAGASAAGRSGLASAGRRRAGLRAAPGRPARPGLGAGAGAGCAGTGRGPAGAGRGCSGGAAGRRLRCWAGVGAARPGRPAGATAATARTKANTQHACTCVPTVIPAHAPNSSLGRDGNSLRDLPREPRRRSGPLAGPRHPNQATSLQEVRRSRPGAGRPSASAPSLERSGRPDCPHPCRPRARRP